MEKDKLLKSFSFVGANIADQNELVKRKIDTIVNAAKPTLMGSDQGVDGSIHKAIDSAQGKRGYFNDMICNELGTGGVENLIRCQRGEAILTSGHGLCKYIIHVVGAKYDGGRGIIRECSSSTVQVLESCYYNIVEVIKVHPDIERVAIPVISSGEYGFPFPEAVKIAVTSVYNAIIEWKLHDFELFELSGLKRIYFFVYDENEVILQKRLQEGNEIIEKYEPIMAREKRTVFQSSARAHLRYWKEIIEYDENRGYFSGAKLVRELLMFIRLFFLPAMALKDWIGGRNWERRRQFVEWFAIVKVFIPILFYLMATYKGALISPAVREWIFPILLIYNMSDTITYLLTLVIMADIQRPSANIIRSMIMLFVNYLEVSFGMAYLCYGYYGQAGKNILFREAIAFGALGIGSKDNMMLEMDYVFTFADAGIKFFFITLVFGYFANHMHQRKFRS